MAFFSFLSPPFKNDIIKSFLAHRPYFLVFGGLMVLSLFILLLDDSDQQLMRLKDTHKNQIGAVTLWQNYEVALRNKSPLFSLFDRYQKIPQWNRAKIQHVVTQLMDIYDLRLRQFQIAEEDLTRESFTGLKVQKVRLTVGAIHDKSLFKFIQYLKDKMQPWIQIRRLTLQRCGNVDEIMLKGLNGDNRIDIVEACFELEWLLNFEESDTGH